MHVYIPYANGDFDSLDRFFIRRANIDTKNPIASTLSVEHVDVRTHSKGHSEDKAQDSDIAEQYLTPRDRNKLTQAKDCVVRFAPKL